MTASKTEVLALRLSPALLAALRTAAERRGCNASEMARHIIGGELERARNLAGLERVDARTLMAAIDGDERARAICRAAVGYKP